MPIPVCPNCSAVPYGRAAIDGSSVLPKPGDLSVCAHCAVPLVHTDAGGLRLLQAAEFLALSDEERRHVTVVTVTVSIGLFLAGAGAAADASMDDRRRWFACAFDDAIRRRTPN